MGVELTQALTLKQRRQGRRDRAKRAKPVKTPKAVRQEPTPEQTDKGEYQSAGMAYRRTPVIDTMLKREQITSAEYVALNYYREQAIAAEKSPIKSNIDFSVSGGSKAILAPMTPQAIETRRIEANLGALVHIARAVVVHDYSISEWCIEKHGGRDKLQGKRWVIVPARDSDVDGAIEDLKMAARRIVI